MSIPPFHKFFLPFLQQLQDEQPRRLSEIIENLCFVFEINEEDRTKLNDSGQQTIVERRIGWAGSYLKHALLVTKPKRGWYKISERGLAVLKENPKSIDVPYLMRFEEFVQFHKPKSSSTDTVMVTPSIETTPEELLEQTHLRLKDEFAYDLLEQIKTQSPQFFENLVVNLLLAMGYGGSLQDAGKVVGKSGDGGIDGIINEDRLGLNKIYIQAKRWGNNPVGRPDIQAFSGALDMHQSQRGIFITTSYFTSDAVDFVNRISKRIILIDGTQLTRLMMEYGVGVRIRNTFHVYEIDENVFSDYELH